MNILLIIPNDILGGAEQYLKMVAQYHKNETVEVLFLQQTESKQWHDISEQIHIKHIGHQFKILSFLKLFFYLLKQRKTFDYVFTSHTSVTGLIGVLIKLSVLKKKHFISRESTSIFTRFTGVKLFSYKLLYRLGYSQVDLLVCQTKFMKNQLTNGMPKLAQKTVIKVIPNPIDLQLIRTKESEDPEFTPPENYMVSAGRLIPEKGFDILIHAFKEIAKNNSQLKLLILGEGEERAALEQLVVDSELKDKVLLPGRVANVYPFFKLAKACIVSSRIEGFPNVLLQMMSQNKSVVTTLCAGNMDDIPTILKVPTENAAALSKAITAVIETDNTRNEFIYNNFLLKRSIDFYMEKVNKSLQRQ